MAPARSGVALTALTSVRAKRIASHRATEERDERRDRAVIEAACATALPAMCAMPLAATN
jgi:hypothetical protein